MDPSFPKKFPLYWILIGAAALAVAGATAFFILNRKPSAILQQTLPSDPGLLTITNADHADLTIVSSPNAEVSIDIKGDEEQTDKVRFFSSGSSSTEFDLPEDWGNLEGTVTVPTGTVVEIRTDEKNPLTIQDQKGAKIMENTTRRLWVDTATTQKIEISEDGVDLAGNDAVQFVTEEPDASIASEQGSGGGLNTCGVGSQTLRDRCCALRNFDAPTQNCLGNWTFNNLSRACEYRCPAEPPPPTETPSQTGQNPGNPLPVGGSTSGGYQPPIPGGGTLIKSCKDLPDAQQKDQCCDERLRNPLHLGPHPGFPDCLGLWYFDLKSQACLFRCSTYGEMLNLLNEIEQYAPPSP